MDQSTQYENDGLTVEFCQGNGCYTRGEQNDGRELHADAREARHESQGVKTVPENGREGTSF